MALLAYLALSEQDLSRETLSALLWPDQNDQRSRASLRRALSSIRGALGSHLLHTVGQLVRLQDDPSLTIDVAEYHSLVGGCIDPAHRSLALADCIQPLARAATLYRADFLSGFTLPDSPGFDEWQFFQSEGLRDSLDRVLENLISWHGDRWEYEQAIVYARRRLAQDRLYEPAHRTLIELYALSGQVSAAARQYDECVRILDEELGVEPDDETERLYREIRKRPSPPVSHSGHETAGGSASSVKRDAPSGAGAEDGPRVRLPVQPTPFVGREEELAEIMERLLDPECRLLTLVAPGGMGKTRVAIEAGHRLVANATADSIFRDGVAFVALQPVRKVDDIVYAIAQALCFEFYRDTPPKVQLLDYVRKKHLLMLLDNFEHLAEGAVLLTEILESAPNVKMLVTSREGLRVRQEWFHPLAGMHYSGGRDLGEHSVSEMDAVRLFTQNAQMAQPRFRLGDELDDVVRICRLIDGMPLGIELAAPWVKALSCSQIAGEIERSLDILTSRKRDILERHRSMRAVLDYAYESLSADEQKCLRRLSIFQGGFTLDAAEAVASSSLLTLLSLSEKAVLRVTDDGRYQMHELLRQYGEEKLGELDVEERQTRDRHASYYSNFVAKRYECLKHSGQQQALAVLDGARGNIQLAWDRANSCLDLALIEEAMDGLGFYYEWKGEIALGQSSFGPFRDVECRPSSRELQRVRARALAWIAEFELMAGRPQLAEECLGRCMEALSALEGAGEDARWPKALALLHLGHLQRSNNLLEAANAYDQSCATYDELGCPWEAAIARAWQGEAEREIGHTDRAIELLRSAQTVFEEYGDQRSVGMVLESIARAYLLDQARLDVALETGQRSLQLRRQSRDSVGTATTLLVVSYVYCWLNQPLSAEPLMKEALQIARDLGHKPLKCEAYYIATVIYNYLENAERKRALSERGFALAQELGDVRLMSNFLRSLGNQFMVAGDVTTAHELHVRAFEVQERAGIQAMLPWLHVVRAFSSWKLGFFDEAQRHTSYALAASVERSDLYTAVHALLFVAQVIAVRGELCRAAEIGAAARAVSRWERSLTGRKVFVEPLMALTRSLPPVEAEAAKRRGQTRDAFDVADELLAEIERPSWKWE